MTGPILQASCRVITLSPLELSCRGRVLLNLCEPKTPFRGIIVTNAWCAPRLCLNPQNFYLKILSRSQSLYNVRLKYCALNDARHYLEF